MKKICFILTLAVLHGCSYGLVKSNYMKGKECTTNYGAPIADTGLTVIGTVSTIGLGYIVFLISALSAKPVPTSSYLAVGASAAGTIYAGNSMAYGYEEVSKCRNARRNDSSKK